MSSPWSSFMRYLRTRGRHSTVSDSNQPKDAFFRFSDEDPTLPQFQHGRPTGLHTFIQKTHHSRPSQGITVRTELSTYRTLASVDDSYHEQLKRTYLESYHAKNPTSSGAHTASETNSVPRVYFAAPLDVSEQLSSHDQSYPTAYMGYPSQQLYPAENSTVSRAV
jgi:hypothetical protein